MKKVFAFLMCIAMVLCIPVAVSAKTTATVTVGSVNTAKVGDVVAVDISVSAQSNIGILELELNYDETYLKPTTTKDARGNDVYYTTGAAATEATALVMTSDGGNPIKFTTVSALGYWEAGVMGTVYFEVLKQGTSAVIPVCTSIQHYDDTSESYALKLTPGAVTAGATGSDSTGDNDATLTVGSVQGNVGEVVTVDVTIAQAKTMIGALELSIDYDSTMLKPVEDPTTYSYVAMGPVSNDATVAFNPNQDPLLFACSTADGFKEAGIVFSMYFEVLKEGTSEISLDCTYIESVEDASKTYDLTLISGFVTTLGSDIPDQPVDPGKPDDGHEPNVTFTVGSAQGIVGDTVAVDIMVSEHSDIGALTMALTYDESVLRPTTTKNNRGDDVYFTAGSAATAAKALIEGSNGGNPFKLTTASASGYWEGGTIWTVYFKIISDPGAGTEIVADCEFVSHYSDSSHVYYPETVAGTVSSPSALFRYVVEDGNATITGYNGTGGAVTIPATIDDHPIVAVGDSAFVNNSTITSVTLATGIVSIGEKAFFNCDKLVSFSLPASVTTIGREAFAGCDTLTAVIIPATVTKINDGAFAECASLNAIVVMSGNENYSVENGVLYNKEKTVLLQYPAGKTDVEFTVPETVTAIPGYAFAGNTHLAAVTVGDSVSFIGYSAFANCTLLSVATIGDSVTSVGNNAFAGCDALTIYGYSDSAICIHAEENNIPFSSLDELYKDDSTGVKVIVSKGDSVNGGTLISVITGQGNSFVSYSLLYSKNGQMSQPDGTVTVKLPVPQNMSGNSCTVYTIGADGTKTDMNATYMNGYMVFETDNFGNYTMVDRAALNSLLYGDASGDGKVDAADALQVLQNAVGKLNFNYEQTALTDVNNDGRIDAGDALQILQKAVGKIESFPVELTA